MLCHFEVNRDLWFTLPPQRSLLVLWLFSAIPIPILKFPILIYLVVYFLINPVMDYEISFIDNKDCCE